MEYCLVEPNINLFILGDIENFGFDQDFQEVWIQTLEGYITGILLRYHDNLIIYSRDLDMDFQEVNSFLDTLKVRVISGKGTGMDRLYGLIADRFSKREMSFCELTETNRLLKETPEVERAEVADALEIAEVYSQISEFTGLYAADVNLRLKEISNRIKTKEGVHMFIKHDGKIISHANSAGETSVSGMIGGLLTLPAYRQQGLARKVISAVCRDLANRGKTACLFYDNPKADNLYQSLGFKATNKWTILEKLIKD